MNAPEAARRFRRIVRIAVLALAVLAAVPCRGESDALAPPALLIEADPSDAPLAQRAAAAVTDALRRFRADLDLPAPARVAIRVVRGRAAFDRACGGAMPDWMLAVALRDSSAIVIDAARAAPASVNDFNLTLYHECAHLALFTLERGRADPFPLWFHEGFAQWTSLERVIAPPSAPLPDAARRIPFDRLEKHFPSAEPESALAYRQSLDFLTYILRTRPAGALRALFDFYRTGDTFDAAFEKAFGASRAALEAEWGATPFRRPGWLRALLRDPDLIAGMALLTLVAFGVVWLRARRQRRRWLQEERAFTLDTEDRNADDYEEPDPSDPTDLADDAEEPPWL